MKKLSERAKYLQECKIVNIEKSGMVWIDWEKAVKDKEFQKTIEDMKEIRELVLKMQKANDSQ